MAKKYKSKKNIKRIFLITVFCFAINFYVIYSVFSIFSETYSIRKSNDNLTVKLNELKDEEEVLKSEVKKLKDPVYIAKYAREKFLYSGEDEYIIRMK